MNLNSGIPRIVALSGVTSDYHLFLGDQRLKNDNEVKTVVMQWLTSQAAEFYDEGIHKLVQRYDKCRNIEGNYVEK